jgi:hypothetical protein
MIKIPYITESATLRPQELRQLLGPFLFHLDRTDQVTGQLLLLLHHSAHKKTDVAPSRRNSDIGISSLHRLIVLSAGLAAYRDDSPTEEHECECNRDQK